MISPILLELLQHFEGFRASSYLDAAGLATVGYGHLILQGETFDQPLSLDAATKLLLDDVSRVEREVDVILSDLTPAPYERDALVSFAFNLGAAALRRSTLLRLFRQGLAAG